MPAMHSALSGALQNEGHIHATDVHDVYAAIQKAAIASAPDDRLAAIIPHVIALVEPVLLAILADDNRLIVPIPETAKNTTGA